MSNSKNLTIAGIIISVLLFFFILTGLFGMNNILVPNPASKFWLSRIELWIALFIIYLFAVKVEKNTLLLWKEQRKTILFYVLAILAIVVLLTILLTGLSLFLKRTGQISNDKVLNTITNILCNNFTLLIFTCLTAAFTEEIIFRGYLLPRLEIILKNKWASIVLSAILFGLAHIGYGDFARMLLPFFVGLVFGIFYYNYRSLAVLIICHFLMDFYSLYGACK